jgi:ABC-type bacteriocin/lantibiotic exporter with double-glycine peptidase domain
MAKATVSPWKRLSDLLNLDKAEVTQLYIYAVFSGLIGLSLPLGIQSVIHFIQGGVITTSWVLLIIFVIFGVISAGVLQILQLRITENIQQQIYTRYSFDFAFRFPRLNRLVIADKNPREWMNRFFDIISLQKGIAKVLLELPSAALQIGFSLLVLSFYHPFYIAFSILLVVIIFAVFKPIIRRGFETSLEESGHKYKTAHWLQEIARADWSFRLVPNGDHPLKRLDRHSQNYLNARESHFKVLWKQYLWMIAIKALIVAALLALGGFLVIDQQMNLGQFVAAEILILLILASVEKIILLLETLYDVFTSLEKLGQLKDLPMAFEDDYAEQSVSSIFPLELLDKSNNNDILLVLNKEDRLHLKSKNAKNVIGYMRALIDPTINEELVPRWNFTNPTPSKMATTYCTIGWFEKETHLFDGTLRENLVLGRDYLGDQEIFEALETVNMIDFIKARELGYETPIFDKHKSIVATEREKFLIARAIIHRPKILFLSLHDTAIEEEELQQILQRIIDKIPDISLIVAAPFDLNIRCKVLPL